MEIILNSFEFFYILPLDTSLIHACILMNGRWGINVSSSAYAWLSVILEIIIDCVTLFIFSNTRQIYIIVNLVRVNSLE